MFFLPEQMAGPPPPVAAANPDEIPKVDAPGVAAKYGIMSIPTIALFVDGAVRAQVVGARPKDDIVMGLGLNA